MEREGKAMVQKHRNSVEHFSMDTSQNRGSTISIFAFTFSERLSRTLQYMWERIAGSRCIPYSHFLIHIHTNPYTRSDCSHSSFPIHFRSFPLHVYGDPTRSSPVCLFFILSGKPHHRNIAHMQTLDILMPSPPFH